MTRVKVIKDLEIIYRNLEKAYNKAENLSKQLDLPPLTELKYVKDEVESLIKLSKGDK